MSDIRILPTPEKQQNDAVVRDAEEILRAAKAGEIDGIICVMTEPNTDFRVLVTGGMGMLRKLGALRMAEHDIISEAVPATAASPTTDGP